MMNSLVSVIIPYYNNETTIKETIESVLNQTYKSIEIILVDDGSRVELHEIIGATFDKQNLTYLKQENSGVSIARNNGARKAKGEFLIFLDADDLIKPSYIEKCIQKFDLPDTKIVYTDARMFGRCTELWNLPIYTNFRDFLKDNIIYISAVIRRNDFINANGFDTELTHYEDWDLWISILKNGGNVIKINEELFLYRKTEFLTSATDQADKSNNIRAINRLKIFLKHHDLYSKYYTNFENMFFKYLAYEERKKKISFTKKLKHKLKAIFTTKNS